MSLFKQPPTGSVLSFGELLIRFCPDAEGDWLRNNQLPFYIGGAELNVAHALALWEVPVKYFTALPGNGLSAQLVNHLQAKGIDTSLIGYGEGRIGQYFLTTGHDLKHDALIYDRSSSAFSNLKTGVIDWDKVLNGICWLHFSAICPAISQNIADVCKEGLEAAQQKGITISIDLNYRAKLWQYGKTPLQIMPGLVSYCDVIMGNIWAEEMMLGINNIPDILNDYSQDFYLEQSLISSKSIMKAFPKCKAVANTFRFDATNDVKYYATLYTGEQLYHSGQYETNRVIDKAGSGDCFMAGLIYGFYNGLSQQDTLEYATVAAFQKLFVKGDATDKTVLVIKKSIK